MIDELTIRIPGYSPEDGRELSADVVRRVGEAMAGATKSVDLSSMHLSLQLNSNMDRGRLAMQVAEKIISQLKLATR